MLASLFIVPLALMAAMGTNQVLYDYPSNTVTYTAGMTYVICSDCPGPTPKQLLPVKPPVRQDGQVKTAQPGPQLRLDPNKILFTQPQVLALGNGNPSQASLVPLSTVNKVQREQLAGAKQQTVAIVPSAPQQTLRETLYFEYNSSKLPDRDKIKLNEIKQAASAIGARVTITGFTDKRGNKRYNNRLALLRAKAVRQYLGLGKEAVVIGKGKCCYLDETHQGKNRRVEVVIEREAPNVQKAVDLKPTQPVANVTASPLPHVPAESPMIVESEESNVAPAEPSKIKEESEENEDPPDSGGSVTVSEDVSVQR